MEMKSFKAHIYYHNSEAKLEEEETKDEIDVMKRYEARCLGP